MRDPLRRLFSRLDGGEVVLNADDRWDLAEDWDALTASGLLAETAPATVVECASCDRPHSEAVFSVETDGRPARWFHRCPDAGSVRVDPQELRRWVVRVPALGRVVTDRDAEERVPERVWRLGSIPVGSTARVGWLVAGWRRDAGLADRVPELRAPNAVVFVPHTLPADSVWGTVPPVVVPLIEVICVTGTGMELDRPALAGYLPPEPTAVAKTDTRPRLTLPAGTRWEDLTLVVGDHHVELHIGAARHRIGYEDLGLIDGRTDAPNAVWWTLVRLARMGELATGDRTRTKPATLKNNVSELRIALKRWCGLPDDPFQPVLPLHPYKPRFRVLAAETLEPG